MQSSLEDVFLPFSYREMPYIIKVFLFIYSSPKSGRLYNPIGFLCEPQ